MEIPDLVIYTDGAKLSLFSPRDGGRCQRGIFRHFLFGCGVAALGFAS